MKNKKAQVGEQTMNLSLLLQLGFLALGIIAGVWIFFYNSGYDFRSIDAELLNSRLQSCFRQNNLNFSLPREEFFKELFETCKIEQQEITDDWVIAIYIDELSEPKYKHGDPLSCQLQSKNEGLPRCVESTFQITINEKTATITLYTGTNQRSIVRRTV